jgi:hypothetical protein
MDETSKPPEKSTDPPTDPAKPRKSWIVDTTDEFLGHSFIITGPAPPKKPLTATEREEALRKPFQNATEKPPEK